MLIIWCMSACICFLQDGLLIWYTVHILQPLARRYGKSLPTNAAVVHEQKVTQEVLGSTPLACSAECGL